MDPNLKGIKFSFYVYKLYIKEKFPYFLAKFAHG
jgi:hypothetical protein